MNKEILYIDMDGVIADYQSVAASGLDKNDPSFFAVMPVMEGAKTAIDKLSQYYDIHFLSTAPWSKPSAWTAKRVWLEQHFPNHAHKRLHLSHHKNLFIGAYLVDDRTANGAASFQGQHIHFGQFPYENWTDVTNYLITQKTANSMNTKTLLEQLQDKISAYLDLCDDGQTPTLCNLISSPEGRQKATELIANIVADEGKSIAEAAMEVEHIYNENKMEV